MIIETIERTLIYAGLLFLPGILSGSDPPNVVIFFTDDQGTLDANCYGSTDLYTPTIDELAATGVRFTQAYSHLYCCPARAMLLTGRHPQRTGIHDWAQNRPNDRSKTVLARREVTLAEALRDAGYQTALFGKWHLGADDDFEPTEHGFDEFFGHRSGFIDNYLHHFLHGKGFHDLYEGKKEIHRKGEYFPELVTGRALDFIERNQSQPFFLYFASNLPHYPEQADPKFDKRYEHLEMPRRDYAKTISTVDDHMGRVLRKLEELGLREKTIIVFQSDNGHSAEDYQISHPEHASGLPLGHNYGPNKGSGNTGKWIGQKGTFFEGGIRVPAIVSYPAVFPRGGVRDQLITAMDWMPTVLNLCGVKRPDLDFDGHDLSSVIQENAASPNRVMHWHWATLWAVREGDWKLVQNRSVPLALYNLADNEPEQVDHLTNQPAMVSRLQSLHEDWLTEVMPEPDLTVLKLPEAKAPGVVVHSGKKPFEAWLFEGEGAGLEITDKDLTPLSESGFILKVNAKVDRVEGMLFQCGEPENGVALRMEDQHLAFAITLDGETTSLRSPEPLIPTGWCAVTAEVDTDGHLYLAVKDQDPVHVGGPGDLTAALSGPVRIGDHFTGRIKNLEVIMPRRSLLER
ncbi:MAG: sulfatase-like hydrolase/transferase [Verrucomicrobiota bacterium]